MDNKQFISAGKAIFTTDNGKGDHFTFKVVKPKKVNGFNLNTAFLYVLTGPDNNSNYTYAGAVDLETGTLRETQNSKIHKTAQSFKVAQWLLFMVWQGKTLPEGYRIQHEGRCGRCGRKLTHPQSIQSGIGPECEKEMGMR